MAEGAKKFKGMLIGGIATGVAAVITFIVRMALNIELEGIKSSSAAIVQAGTKQMSKKEYIEYATGMVNNCTALVIILLVITVVLIGLYVVKNQKKSD